VEVRVLSSALTVIVASLTRTTPVKRPFRFILVFADDTHAHHQLLCSPRDLDAKLNLGAGVVTLAQVLARIDINSVPWAHLSLDLCA
jgi:hypothetical protein